MEFGWHISNKLRSTILILAVIFSPLRPSVCKPGVPFVCFKYAPCCAATEVAAAGDAGLCWRVYAPSRRPFMLVLNIAVPTPRTRTTMANLLEARNCPLCAWHIWQHEDRPGSLCRIIPTLCAVFSRAIRKGEGPGGVYIFTAGCCNGSARRWVVGGSEAVKGVEIVRSCEENWAFCMDDLWRLLHFWAYVRLSAGLRCV